MNSVVWRWALGGFGIPSHDFVIRIYLNVAQDIHALGRFLTSIWYFCIHILATMS
jgi:hypothetical protein